MNNFELIDDYLTNRLNETEKASFEKQVDADATLKADVELQRSILEGVKKARAAELKAMLQKVPVGGGATFQMPLMKMAAGVVGAGLLIAVLSYYFQNNRTPNLSTSLEDSIKKIDPSEFEPLEEPVAIEIESTKKEEVKSVPTEKKKAEAKEKKVAPVTQPKIEVVDPTQDMMEESSKISIKESVHKSAVTISQINVDVFSNDKNYTFHYQFSNGKLLLYGSFDKSLYEILEINGDAHTVFMFYKENYFLLDETQTKISPLQPIKDAALISKLKEYRGR